MKTMGAPTLGRYHVSEAEVFFLYKPDFHGSNYISSIWTFFNFFRNGTTRSFDGTRRTMGEYR